VSTCTFYVHEADNRIRRRPTIDAWNDNNDKSLHELYRYSEGRLETESEDSASALAGLGGVGQGSRVVDLVVVGVPVCLDVAQGHHHVAHADLAAADLLSQAASLERRRQRLAELLRPIDGRQPEAERRRVVVARAAAVALDERRRTERLEARAGRVQRLTGAVRSGASVLQQPDH